MNEVLDYLAKVEGDKVHFNAGEVDITAPYGIYRRAHPDAEVFEYIDSVAEELGVVAGSAEWTAEDIDSVNLVIDDSRMRVLAGRFYTEYLSGAKLEMFPVECRVAMMSMYTNSPKLAWKAVQRALIAMSKSGKLSVPVSELSVVDGAYGGKTEYALAVVASEVDPMYFETLMLFKMLCEYVELGNARYLAGWKNRMDKLTNE